MSGRQPRAASSRAAGTPARSLATGLLEAVWLVALVVTPLYFNPRTERVFEPDKLAWVLVLGLMALWAHTVRAAEAPGWRGRGSSPLVWAAVGVGAVLLLGTATSAVPTVSVWGLYRRGQGVLVHLSYLLLFAAVAATASRPGAMDRAARTLGLVSVPIALYVILQRMGVDTMAWQVDGAGPHVRPFGPLGNPIFLGAYLVLAMPVVVGGFLAAWSARRRGKPGSGARAAGFGLAAALSLVALVLSQSRGPVLGLIVGVGVFAVLWAAAAGRRRAVVSTFVAGTMVVAALLVTGQVAGGRVGRLGALLDVGSRTARERLLLWGALGELAAADPLRAVIGYGPETMAYVLPPFLPDELIRLAPDQVFDRAHNVVWEWWISAGLLGMLALWGLYLAACLAAFERLGLIRRRRGRLRLVGAILFGLAAGALLPAVAGAPELVALGLPVGFLAGSGLYLVTARRHVPAGAPTGDGVDGATVPSLLIVGLVAGLAAHLVEGAVGLPTASGEVLFWVFLGLLAARPSPTSPTGSDRRGVDAASEGNGTDWLPDSIVAGLVLATVAFSPVLVASRGGGPFAQPAIWLLPLATWLSADLLAAGGARAGWRGPAARVAVTAALVALLALFASPTGGEAMAFGVLVAVVTVALGAALTRGRRGDGDGGTDLAAWRWPVYVAAGLLAAVGGWRLAVAQVVADAHVRSGLETAATQDGGLALDHFGRAMALAPAQTTYGAYVAAAYRDVMVDPTQAPDVRERAFDAAVEALRDALARVPDAALHRRLGALYRDRGDMTAHPAAQDELWWMALAEVNEALRLRPRDPASLVERAGCLERVGDAGSARSDYADAVDLGGPNTYWLVGESRTALADGDLEAAVDGLERALALGDPAEVEGALDEASSWPVDRLAERRQQVIHLALVGRLADANKLHEALLGMAPDDPLAAEIETWLSGRSGGLP